MKAAANTKYYPGSAKDKRQKLLAARKKELGALRDRAVKAGLVEHGLAPTEVVQRLIDDAFIEYLTEQERVRNLQAEGQKVATAKLQKLRRDAAYFASLALQYNIADRQTKQQEIRTQLLATLLQQVLRDPSIGLADGKIRRIPALLDQKVIELQGLAAEHSDKATPPHMLRD